MAAAAGVEEEAQTGTGPEPDSAAGEEPATEETAEPGEAEPADEAASAEEASAEDDESGRGGRRGRRGGRRRRTREGGDGLSALGEPGVEQPDLPYAGPTPANPFGGQGYDIFEAIERAEEQSELSTAPKPEPAPVKERPDPEEASPAQASVDAALVAEVDGPEATGEAELSADKVD